MADEPRSFETGGQARPARIGRFNYGRPKYLADLGDSFQFNDNTKIPLTCGHIYSAPLDDGDILTCYGHYLSKGGCLIKWDPTTNH